MERWTLDIGQKIGYEGTGFLLRRIWVKGEHFLDTEHEIPPSALKILEILKNHIWKSADGCRETFSLRPNSRESEKAWFFLFSI